MTCTDSEHSSNEQDGLPQDATRTPLNEDSHQHGLMLAAYREVGSDYSVDNGQLVKGTRGLEVLRVCTSQMAFTQAHRSIVEKCGVLGQGSSWMLLGGAHL